MRRENHIARDLRTPKYRQRRVEDKKREKKWSIKDYERDEEGGDEG